jgi:hypothetical protein
LGIPASAGSGTIVGFENMVVSESSALEWRNDRSAREDRSGHTLPVLGSRKARKSGFHDGEVSNE